MAARRSADRHRCPIFGHHELSRREGSKRSYGVPRSTACGRVDCEQNREFDLPDIVALAIENLGVSQCAAAAWFSFAFRLRSDAGGEW
jgi:hypothetical protein